MSAALWNGPFAHSEASRRVLLSAWQANRNRSSLWLLALLCLPMLSAPVVVWWNLRALQVVSVPLTAVVFMAMPLAAMVLVWVWAKLVYNVLLQNHPHTARLLPAQVPVLRNTLWAAAALLCALATLLSWVMGGPVLVTAAGSAVGLAWLALGLRWARLWLVVATLGFSLPVLSAGGHLAPVLSVWHAAPEVLTLLALVLAALALRAVVMTGDARHERAHARLQLTNAALRGQVTAHTLQTSGTSGWFRSLLTGEGPYAAWMARVLAGPPQSVGRRLALGLGPKAHWTSLAVGQALGLLMILLMLWVFAMFPDWGPVQGIASSLLMGVSMNGLMLVMQQLPGALWASRREQTLLCLLPGVPQGARLNRWLALHLARMVLLVLALLLIVVWVLVRFANAYIHGGKYDELPLAMVVLAAPWMFLLWKNWAHARAPLGNAAGQVVLGMAVVGGLAAAWVFGLDRPWYELAALTLLLMLPLGWWRWRVISRAPVAWPVGRLG